MVIKVPHNIFVKKLFVELSRSQSFRQIIECLVKDPAQRWHTSGLGNTVCSSYPKLLKKWLKVFHKLYFLRTSSCLVCEKFKNVSRTSAIASITQTSATERELQRRKVLELRRVISHHFGVLSMIYRKFNDKISCKETSLLGLIPFMVSFFNWTWIKNYKRMKGISESHRGRSKYRISKQSGITCEWFLRWSRSRFERRFKSCVCFSKKSTWMWKLKSIQRSQSIRCNNNLFRETHFISQFFLYFQNFQIKFFVQS